MVAGRILSVLMLIVIAADANAISADDLRNFSNETARERDAKASRAKSTDPAAMVPDVKSRQTQEPRQFRRSDDAPALDNSPAASRKSYSRPQRSSSAAATIQAEPAGTGGYQPPVPVDKAIVSDAIPAMKNFGIRLGTWMEGNINRNTSSAEPGMVEIELTSDVIGDKRTLKAGTLLFAGKQINGQTKRLEMVVQNGITPSGEEFKLTGLIFDLQKVSGLAGIISVDNDETLKRGAGKGLLAGLGAAAQSMAGQTPVGAAVGAGSQSILQDKGSVVDQATEQKLTIYVSPQPLLIRVEKTF